MKVFICERSVDFEGSKITAVFSTIDKAKFWCVENADELRKKNSYYGNFDIEDLPQGKKVMDICFTFEEWEVT